MTVFIDIYVRLLNESVDVWRPVKARRVRHGIYQILDQPYDVSIESWEFGPGNDVYCEETEIGSGHRLVAVNKNG